MNEIYEAMRNAGLLTPDNIILDGQIHRYHANSDKRFNNDSGWYVFYDELAGAFGDWSRDITVRFCSYKVNELSAEEQERRRKLVHDVAEMQERLRAEEAAKVSIECKQIWENLSEAVEHPYLNRKGLKSAYGARIQGNKLVIPLFDENGGIWSLQTISEDGSKSYHTGGRVKGCYYQIGPGTPTFMAEGFATAASVYEATGRSCVVAFSAGNLINLAKVFPNTVIVADNDESLTGETKAKASGLKYILIPEKGMDANDYVTSGHNLRALLLPPPQFKIRPASEFIADSVPQTWLIKGWIPRGRYLGMNFGPSANGKTFVLIDMMLSVACGLDWHGRKVNQAKVLYLCGEGSDSVKERMEVWQQQNQMSELSNNIWMSESATDIDTPDGMNALLESLSYYDFKPELIVIDTLNRFMKGDENDTQKATAFIQSCSKLMDIFNCCVYLVHHTGLAEDAQNRARGSSVFKGALDFQHMTVKSNDVFCVSQTKVKRGKTQDPIYLQLEDHEIVGKLDEDGEEVFSAILVETDSKPKAEIPKKQQEDEELIIAAFVNAGFMYMDKAFITRDKLVEQLIELKGTKRESIEKDIRVRQGEFKKMNLMERLVKAYRDCEVETDKTGQVKGFWCNEIIKDGIAEPYWSMSLKQKEKNV